MNYDENQVEFTCASQKDNGKVTVTVNRLENTPYSDGVPAHLLTSVSRIIVEIVRGRKNFEVVFTPNRFNAEGVATTAATNTWPRELRLPKVGKPVTYEVVGVMYV